MSENKSNEKFTANYDAKAASLAAEIWKRKFNFGTDFSINENRAKNEGYISNPIEYFHDIHFKMSMHCASMNTSPDMISYLPYNHTANSYVYELVENKNKYFALCLFNNIIFDYINEGYIFNPDKFIYILQEFIEEDRINRYIDIREIFNSLAVLLGIDAFYEARGVIIKDNGVRKKFLTVADAKSVGDMFATARKRIGKSQRAAAKDSGIDPKNLRQLENGETDPSLKTIKRIADSMGYDVEVSLVPKGNE